MMKNLHFYIQTAMLIIALSLAVQIPVYSQMIFFVVLIEFFLLVYQFVMSALLMSKLSYRPNLLKIHFFGSLGYIFTLIVLSLSGPSWMSSERWGIALLVIPWGGVVLFLVTINELERARHYRL